MAETNPMAPKSPAESGEAATPEDVATLYSWANLHGAKYRDFSASRAQAREEARLRFEEALAEQRRKEAEEAERRAQEEAQIAARLAAEAAEAARQAEAERLAEIARQAEAERQAVLAAQEAQRQAAQQRSWQPAPPEVYQAGFAADFPLPYEAEHPSSEFRAIESSHGYSRQELMPQPAFTPRWDQTGTPAFDPNLKQAPHPGYAEARPAPSGTEWAPSTPSAAQARPLEQRKPEQPQPEQSSWDQARQEQNSPHPSMPLPAQASAPQTRMYAASPTSSPQNYPAQTPPSARQTPPTPAHEAPYTPQEIFLPSPWIAAEARESREMASGPAWLAPELPARPPEQTQYTAQSAAARPAPVASAPPPQRVQPQGASQNPNPYANPDPHANPDPGPADDTLLASRDRIASRWFALKGVFDPQGASVEQLPAPPPARVPALAVFSLAGGVGKTSLVASLGRALSSRGERVLLVDTAAYGLLPFFFGARDQRPGQLRTFNPPGASADSPIQLVTLDPESHPPESTQHPASSPGNPNASTAAPSTDWLAQEVGRFARSANRVLIDLPTASGATTRRVLRLAPIVLVPVLPDMNSVVSVGAIEGFFRNNASLAGGQPVMPYYVLNQFDYSLPLHLDVREILREQIGDRLIPFALRRSASISEALAEGMTVIDYAPTAVVAEDYANLAGWVRSFSAPATQSYRGVRWSER